MNLFWLLIFSSMCRANIIGNDTQNFNPTTSGLDFITVQSSQTLAHGLLNTGIFLNYARNSLPPTWDSQGQLYISEDTVTFSDINFGYGLSDHTEMGVNFSSLLAQQTSRVATGAQFSGTGLNEIRLSGKYSFQKVSAWGQALGASLNLNQTRENPFVGTNPGPTFNLEAILDHVVGPWLVAGNLGYRFRNPGAPIANSIYKPLPNQFVASLGASHYFARADLKLIAEVYGSQPVEPVPKVEAGGFASEMIVGGKYDAWKNISLDFGLGTELGDGLFTPKARAYAGMNLVFDVAKKPAAPAAPRALTREEIIHLQLYKGYLPEDIEALVPVPFDEIAKTHEFHLRTTVPERDFAGEKPPFEIIRLDEFNFDTGSYQIRPEYYDLLDRLAQYLASKPDVIKIRIEGHTDSLGSLSLNKVLSQNRANALKSQLEKSGLFSGPVLEPVGFGAERPISDNGNYQGRTQNRRVEIRILRRLPPVPESLQQDGR